MIKITYKLGPLHFRNNVSVHTLKKCHFRFRNKKRCRELRKIVEFPFLNDKIETATLLEIGISKDFYLELNTAMREPFD